MGPLYLNIQSTYLDKVTLYINFHKGYVSIFYYSMIETLYIIIESSFPPRNFSIIKG